MIILGWLGLIIVVIGIATSYASLHAYYSRELGLIGETIWLTGVFTLLVTLGLYTTTF